MQDPPENTRINNQINNNNNKSDIRAKYVRCVAQYIPQIYTQSDPRKFSQIYQDRLSVHFVLLTFRRGI